MFPEILNAPSNRRSTLISDGAGADPAAVDESGPARCSHAVGAPAAEARGY
ncbi:hypothetical protein ACL02U_07485 [Streptomyces sp. MS06]|uniref:hypothetical protein n=1 Tax=Streptomyces sp. MS06 TaxID=3385974 RepID=UPI00399F1FF7